MKNLPSLPELSKAIVSQGRFRPTRQRKHHASPRALLKEYGSKHLRPMQLTVAAMNKNKGKKGTERLFQVERIIKKRQVKVAFLRLSMGAGGQAGD